MQYEFIEKIFRIFVASIFIAAGGSAYAETLRIGGTGVALGGMKILGEAFEQQHPGTAVEVLPSLGSSGGVKALIAGAVDLAVSSRALKDAEIEQGASARLYATTPLAVVTSIGTKADTITTKELARMYAGTMQNWSSGERVRVVLRPATETDTQILRSLSDDMARAVDSALERPGLVSATNDQVNAETLENLPGSVGVVALGQIATEDRKLKVLEHDGVFPNAAEPDERNMAFAKSLYVVETQSLSDSAKRFVAFVFSAEGQAILESFDHSPQR